MRKKYKVLLIIAFASIVLILFLTMINQWKKNRGVNETLNLSDTIQSVEIVDGTSGNQVNIDETDELNEIHMILQESKLVSILNSEETTGYKWRVIIKSRNHLIEVKGSDRVIYDKKAFKFSNNDDYARFEECIADLYKQYAKAATD